MAKCEFCGKCLVFGNNVSHSHRKSSRTWNPNIRKVKANINGAARSVSICSRCLRSDKIQRAVKTKAPVVSEAVTVEAAE